MDSTALIYIVIVLLLAAIVLLIVLLQGNNKGFDTAPLTNRLDSFDTRLSNEFSTSRREHAESLQGTRTEVTGLFANLSTGLFESLKKSQTETQTLSQNLSENVKFLNETIKQRLDEMSTRNDIFRKETEERLKEMRTTLENKVGEMQKSNESKLEEMRKTVDEKLQKTLDERLAQSFKQVSDRLEMVHKGLGEMQNLAQDVGGLKKILSNVKSRGILGEIQLGSILENILSPEQYKSNIKTNPESSEVVEYVICLPGKDEDGGQVYLPIDSKFPVEAYSKLLDAYDTADLVLLEQSKKMLETEIRRCAKDISTKYLNPPHTTDFGILFLPTEGLYAEIVRNTSLLELLQREMRIVVTGPSTLAAFLNSLQMGFRTLAIEKRSSEVWKILGSVRKEFETFGGVLDKAQTRLRQASEDIEKLVGTRTKQIQRHLKKIDMHQIEDTPLLPLINDDTEDETEENN